MLVRTLGHKKSDHGQRSGCIGRSKAGQLCCWGIRVESLQSGTVPSESFFHEHCGACGRLTTVISCSEASWDELPKMLFGDYSLQTCLAAEIAC